MPLTSKNRAELRRQGQTLDPVIWVGKAGLIPSIEKSADEVLTTKELVKGKVQPESPVTAKEAADALSKACQAEIVSVIGRTFLLFRRNPEKPWVKLED